MKNNGNRVCVPERRTDQDAGFNILSTQSSCPTTDPRNISTGNRLEYLTGPPGASNTTLVTFEETSTAYTPTVALHICLRTPCLPQCPPHLLLRREYRLAYHGHTLD